MSGKVKNKGSSNYDTHNNIMALEGDIDDQMKYKINKVMEVIKNRTQDDVMLVLQYFDYDIDTTVDAFIEDGAADILKKWNHTNSIKPSNKNKKKKKNKKKSSIQDASVAATSETVSNGEAEANSEVVPTEDLPLANGDASSDVVSSHVTVPDSSRDSSSPVESSESWVPTPSQTKTEIVPPVVEPPEVEEAPQTKEQELTLCNVNTEGNSETVSITTTTSVDLKSNPRSGSVMERSSVSPTESTRSTTTNRHRSSSGSRSRASEESSRAEMPPTQPAAPAPLTSSTFSQAPGKKTLERSLKDLHRQTIALHRVSNLLEGELDTSFKRIKTAITEAQRLLEERSTELEQEMERVKRESRQLLNQRKDLASELKQRTERAATMGEAELNELRADIKHFVVERKYDYELGKTCRFMWDKDRITQEIRTFGEVYHVKNSYSQRRQSVSSVASSSNMTSSITEPPELSPVSQPDLGPETPGPNPEPSAPDMRPQGNSFPNRARFFFPRRNFVNSESNTRPSFNNRGTYPPRGRGGGEGRGGRGGRGGRRDDGYRGGYDGPYYSKPHYSGPRSDDQGSSGASNVESGTSSWPPREQRAGRRGGGRHNPRFQGRMQSNQSPRRNFNNEERSPAAASDTHVNGNENASLVNGFVDK